MTNSFQLYLSGHPKFFLRFFLVYIGITFFLSSCTVIKPASYLLKNISRDTSISNLLSKDIEIKIQNTDILGISVSSLNPEMDAVFNAPGETKNLSIGYQVSAAGDIFIHKLGKVPVLGITRRELKAKLEKDLQSYFKDPIITVNFENHKVTLLGGMGSGKLLNIPTEKISIFEALGSAGNSLENAKLNDVVIIRENGNAKEIKHINLEDQSIFSSTWYYLQPNDVVVLASDNQKINQEQKRQQTQLITTFILQGVSLFLIIYSNFFKR